MVGTQPLRPPNKQNNNRNTTMKKTYIAPSMDVIKVQVANVMATSSMPISNETVDTNVTDQLSRELENSMKAWEQTW